MNYGAAGASRRICIYIYIDHTYVELYIYIQIHVDFFVNVYVYIYIQYFKRCYIYMYTIYIYIYMYLSVYRIESYSKSHRPGPPLKGRRPPAFQGPEPDSISDKCTLGGQCQLTLRNGLPTPRRKWLALGCVGAFVCFRM